MTPNESETYHVKLYRLTDGKWQFERVIEDSYGELGAASAMANGYNENAIREFRPPMIAVAVSVDDDEDYADSYPPDGWHQPHNTRYMR